MRLPRGRGQRPASSPGRRARSHSRAIEQRLAETQRSLAAVTAQNERLAQTLREARDQIMTLKEEVDRLAQPPAGFGTFLARNDDDSIDVFTGGRKLRVNVSPSVDLDDLQRGQEVMLNEALNVVAALEFEQVGEVVMLKEMLADGDRVLVIANADEERVVRTRRAAARDHAARRRLAAAGLPLRLRLRAGPEVRGRGARPRRGPRHRLRRHRRPLRADRDDPRRRRAALPPPRAVRRARAQAAQGRAALRPARLRQDADRQGGRQLAGQEGRGQDRQRGAAGSRYFLNIKGPELLNKYVGETERHIRLVFQRAREKASEGTPVIVFFDEMDSLFRTRGSGVSSDVENTIVPQLLSEIDGVETAGERPGDRRLQPRGHDRPRDPAARPPRREDQDRAPRRRVRARHLLQVPHRHAAAARRRPRGVRRRPATPASPG